jgi:hypothetical protein
MQLSAPAQNPYFISDSPSQISNRKLENLKWYKIGDRSGASSPEINNIEANHVGKPTQIKAESKR